MPALSAGDGARTVIRPRLGRWVPESLAAVILVADLVLVLALPWDVFNRLGGLGLGLIVAFVLHRLGDVRLVADSAGILVVNPRLRRRLSYAEIVSVSLEPAAPWLVFDLADGSTLSAMAVQGSEGGYAQQQLARVRALVARQCSGG